jgi:CRP-like cAMP-binding protein
LANKIFKAIGNLFAKQVPHPELMHFQLLRELNPAELNIIHSYMHNREFKKGEVLFEEGYPLEVIYLIREGEIQVQGLRSDNDSWLLKKHQFVGIIDLFTKNHRLSKATAYTDLSVFALSQTDFWEIIRYNPVLGVKLLKACCHFLGKFILDTAPDQKQ